MTSVNPALRLIDAAEIGEASVGQLLRDLGAEQREQIAVAITRSHQFQPHAAFICLHGPHTQRYLDAIEQDAVDVLEAIEHALSNGDVASDVLDENSPLRDQLRETILKAREVS